MWAVITEKGMIGEYDSKKEANRVYVEERNNKECFNECLGIKTKEFVVLCKLKKKTVIDEEEVEETYY